MPRKLKDDNTNKPITTNVSPHFRSGIKLLQITLKAGQDFESLTFFIIIAK